MEGNSIEWNLNKLSSGLSEPKITYEDYTKRFWYKIVGGPDPEITIWVRDIKYPEAYEPSISNSKLLDIAVKLKDEEWVEQITSYELSSLDLEGWIGSQNIKIRYMTKLWIEKTKYINLFSWSIFVKSGINWYSNNPTIRNVVVFK